MSGPDLQKWCSSRKQEKSYKIQHVETTARKENATDNETIRETNENNMATNGNKQNSNTPSKTAKTRTPPKSESNFVCCFVVAALFVCFTLFAHLVLALSAVCEPLTAYRFSCSLRIHNFHMLVAPLFYRATKPIPQSNLEQPSQSLLASSLMTSCAWLSEASGGTVTVVLVAFRGLCFE